jgi:hypothetical protein
VQRLKSSEVQKIIEKKEEQAVADPVNSAINIYDNSTLF